LKLTGKIKKRIDKINEGTVFKYQQLGIMPEEYPAATKAIERLIARKAIKRISTGIFYKPRETVFGEIRPGEKELLKPYLFKQNKRIGYITGTSLYNQMGLTTQIPRIIKFASREKRLSTRIGDIQIKSVKSYVDVDSSNYFFLEILDMLKDFKRIPDMDKSMAIKNIMAKLMGLRAAHKQQLVKYALKYPPRARALLGALLNTMKSQNDASLLKKIKQGLNPLTIYDLGISKGILSTASNWNIK